MTPPRRRDALAVRIGQCSDRGRKDVNQDFHGAVVPDGPLLATKGIAVALADGIGSSKVSQVASETAVKGFLEDYYATSDAWSVRTSAERVVSAINGWLHAETQRGQYRHDLERGYVCTFSAVVLRSTTAHVFHVGDARVSRLVGDRLEPLTDEHRVWTSPDRSYLARALGIEARVEIDYRALPLDAGDAFVLATDGVHETVDEAAIVAAIAAHRDDADAAARAIVDEALRRGAEDNVTAQVVLVDRLPPRDADELHDALSVLPPPRELRPGQRIDGYEIVRELHGSHRSHVHLAIEVASGEQVVLKTPSVERQEPAHLERFLMQEWIARRIDSPHVVRPREPAGARSALYVVTDFVDGRTLAQWMADHPRPDVEAVRGIVEQIAAGLLAFHRLGMLHQDLRPENVMIDGRGTIRLIDFGSARVAGIDDAPLGGDDGEMPGAVPYAAPEYFVGEAGTTRSDLFSLGVIAYRMLSGRLPYGTDVAKAKTRAAQRRLRYRSVLSDDREIPAWIDGALRKAVDPDPAARHDELSEFLYDLRHPNPALVAGRRAPLIERDPLVFWKSLSLLLALVVALLLYRLAR